MKKLAELGYEMDIFNFNLLFKLQIAVALPVLVMLLVLYLLPLVLLIFFLENIKNIYNSSNSLPFGSFS